MKKNNYLEKYKAEEIDDYFVFRITKENNEIEVIYYPESMILAIEDMWLVNIDYDKAERIIDFLDEELD